MAASPPSPASDAFTAPFDPERLHALGNEHADCEREVALELLMSVPWLMQEMTRGVVLRDATHLAIHARELQRCCRSLGAAPLERASAALERMGERGEFKGARTLLMRAQVEQDRLQQALAEHLAELRRAA